MRYTKDKTITALEFLKRMEIVKIQGPFKRYSLILLEIIEFMIELTKEYIYNSTLSIYQELVVELNTYVRKTKDKYVSL